MSFKHNISCGPILRPHCGNAKSPFFADDNMRLDSFRNWRGRQDIDLRNLVENGFFYTNFGDSVECYVCGVVIATWTIDMDPLLEHVRNAPFCRHLPELQPPAFLAEIKDQLFGLNRMRVPSNIPLDRNDSFTGCRVETTEHPSTGPPVAVGHDNHRERHSESSDIIQSFRIPMKEIKQEQGPDAAQAVASVSGEFDGEPTGNPDSPGVNIEDMLNTPAALSLLQNGYDQESVTRAVIDLCEQGHRDLKSKDIIEIIHSIEDFRDC